MIRKNTKHSRTEKGQSLVELTISLVVLIMLLIGVVDFGLAFFSWVAIRDASQEGAIFAAVEPSANFEGTLNPNPEIEARVRSSSSTPVDMADATRVRVYVAPLVDPNNLPPDPKDLPPLGCPGSPVTVLVEFDYQSLTPIASSFIGQNGFLTLRASTTNTILTSRQGTCKN